MAGEGSLCMGKTRTWLLRRLHDQSRELVDPNENDRRVKGSSGMPRLGILGTKISSITTKGKPSEGR